MNTACVRGGIGKKSDFDGIFHTAASHMTPVSPMCITLQPPQALPSGQHSHTAHSQGYILQPCHTSHLSHCSNMSQCSQTCSRAWYPPITTSHAIHTPCIAFTCHHTTMMPAHIQTFVTCHTKGSCGAAAMLCRNPCLHAMHPVPTQALTRSLSHFHLVLAS
jgi:hypothetical protein